MLAPGTDKRQNIKEGMITWHGISSGNFVVNVNLKGLSNSWYEEKPEGVVESENFKMLWDFTIQCEARGPDIVFVDRKERCCHPS